MTYATIVPLEHKHCWHQITPRLGFISKALKTKQSLIAVYAGFDTLEEAGKFAVWIAREWGKNPEFDITTRRSKRLNPEYCQFEVKVRRPTLEQLHDLIAVAKAKQTSNVIPMRKAS